MGCDSIVRFDRIAYNFSTR